MKWLFTLKKLLSYLVISSLWLWIVFAQESESNIDVWPDNEPAPTSDFMSVGKSTVDMNRFRQEREKRTNNLREEYGREAYILSDDLNQTSQTWSEHHADNRIKWMSHRRYGSSAYYSYPLVIKWFGDQWVDFANVGWTKATECIWWWYVSCRESDCTDEMIKASRSTWNFFMSERGRKYAPHFNALISKQFSQMWVGIAVDPVSKRYYFTAHFSVETE